jgi:hypothetical protein
MTQIRPATFVRQEDFDAALEAITQEFANRLALHEYAIATLIDNVDSIGEDLYGEEPDADVETFDSEEEALEAKHDPPVRGAEEELAPEAWENEGGYTPPVDGLDEDQPVETPEQEAARLIAEAEAANETDTEAPDAG